VLQRERTDDDESRLVASLAALYGYVYERPVAAMTPAARDRALAMRVSDAWVADGCDVADPRVAEERALLVTSYTHLLAAVRA
jgi:hypothetical protein